MDSPIKWRASTPFLHGYILDELVPCKHALGKITLMFFGLEILSLNAIINVALICYWDVKKSDSYGCLFHI